MRMPLNMLDRPDSGDITGGYFGAALEYPQIIVDALFRDDDESIVEDQKAVAAETEKDTMWTTCTRTDD